MTKNDASVLFFQKIKSMDWEVKTFCEQNGGNGLKSQVSSATPCKDVNVIRKISGIFLGNWEKKSLNMQVEKPIE